MTLGKLMKYRFGMMMNEEPGVILEGRVKKK
jgi:hypothetical protein